MLSILSTLKKIKQADVVKVMKQILAAVNYCHNMHIVHRYLITYLIKISET